MLHFAAINYKKMVATDCLYNTRNFSLSLKLWSKLHNIMSIAFYPKVYAMKMIIMHQNYFLTLNVITWLKLETNYHNVVQRGKMCFYPSAKWASKTECVIAMNLGIIWISLTYTLNVKYIAQSIHLGKSNGY